MTQKPQFRRLDPVCGHSPYTFVRLSSAFFCWSRNRCADVRPHRRAVLTCPAWAVSCSTSCESSVCTIAPDLSHELCKLRSGMEVWKSGDVDVICLPTSIHPCVHTRILHRNPGPGLSWAKPCIAIWRRWYKGWQRVQDSISQDDRHRQVAAPGPVEVRERPGRFPGALGGAATESGTSAPRGLR